MYKPYITSICLAVICLVWHLAFVAPADAQVPPRNPPAGNQPPDLFGPGQSPFGDDTNNVVPPGSSLHNGSGGEPVAPPPPPGASGRDPTMVSPDVRNILDPPTNQPNRGQTPVPRLSGRVSLAGGKTMAVIEIGGDFWIVEEGDRIDFTLGNQGVETLRVMTLSASRVEVKFDREEQAFQLR